MRKITYSAGLLAFALAACGSPDTANDANADNAAVTPAETATDAAPLEATATLQTADGKPAGTATVTAVDGGLNVRLVAQNITPGNHGVHIHMTGACDAPAFTSAGGHWNPAETKHGLDNPEGQHAGDMPNLTVAADGTGTLEYALKGGSFEGLMDADGSAFVIHAGEDDQKTDPSGDSGDRVACGVFNAA